MSNWTALIPARNAAAHIQKTLRSVYNQSFPPFEIVVCINGCTDDTAQRIQELNFPVTVINSEPGKAFAWNKLLEHCKSEYAVFIDDDVIVANRCVQKLLSCLQLQTTADVALPQLYWIDRSSTSVLQQLCLVQEPYVRGLFGACYAVNCNLLQQKMLAKYGSMKMPEQIIREDMYLQNCLSMSFVKDARITTEWQQDRLEVQNVKLRLEHGTKQLLELGLNINPRVDSTFAILLKTILNRGFFCKATAVMRKIFFKIAIILNAKQNSWSWE